jgi:predicted transcriptional regulator
MDTPTERPDWRTLLREQGRTMRWLADNTGKSRRTVYAYSRGDLVPPAPWIVDVSRLLGREVAA